MTAPLVIPTDGHDATQRPDYQRAEYKAQAAARRLCRALMAGTSGVRALGEVGLPRWPSEELAFWKMRASITQVARYYARIVQATVGMIVADPPTLNDGTNPLIVADWEDIDGRGTHGEVFARQVCDDAINGGFSAILVDAPPVPEGLSLTLADEQALGLRPFWVLIPAERLLSWTVETPDWAGLLADYTNGVLTAEQVKAYAKQTILRQVVIHEPTDAPTGAYGSATKDRYRVLRLTDAGVTFTVYEKQMATNGAGERFALIASGMMRAAGGRPFTEIPLATVEAGRLTAPFVAEPPLLGLAEVNLDYYQVCADRRYMMRLCHSPTLFLAGFDTPSDDGTGAQTVIKIGPNSVLRSSDASAKASYVAADPRALDSSQTEREELIRQMATLGMSFLAKDKRNGVETAAGRQLDDAAENASHAVVARGLQDGLEQALKFHAQYRGVPVPQITVNTSYASPTIDAQIAAVLWQAVVANKIDVETWIEYLRTGQLPDDFDAAAYALEVMAASEAQGTVADATATEQQTGHAPVTAKAA